MDSEIRLCCLLWARPGDRAGLDADQGDPRRLALASPRDRVTARTDVFPVDVR